jgi:hypothetical protein
LSRQFESGCEPLPVQSDSPAPQVVIKVVSAGSNKLRSIKWHFEDLQDGKDRAMEHGSSATSGRTSQDA